MASRRTLRALTIVGLALLTVSGWAAQGRDPYGGYVYPAGAQQGTQVRVTVGGQNLQNAKEVYFTGTGLTATVVETVRPLGKKQIRDAGQYLRVLLRQRWAETLRPGTAVSADKLAAELKALDPLQDHPWLRGLEKKSLTELEELRDTLNDPKRQPNAQIGEWAIIDIRVAPNATVGPQEMRVRAPGGLTNPLRFEVSRLPEVCEPAKKSTEVAPVAPPVVLNGQIMPGEVDRFRLLCKRGQKLVIATQARKLVPYLADAVPGWFQAVVALRDAKGREVAYADDYRYDPDPVLLVNVPEDGEYTLEIRDSIYRGREDFIYRVIVGEQPFITSLFPLGGPVGSSVAATVSGWNLPQQLVQLDTAPKGGSQRSFALKTKDWTSNSVSYDVDTLPEALETEPNDLVKQAPLVTLPKIINGRIGSAGDVDIVQFEGKAGEEFVAEVRARRLGSPVDSLLRLTDATGKTVALNDDHEDRSVGLMTDPADSYLSVRLPSTGRYYLHLSDTRRQGGEDSAYRLRLSQPRPDFALRVTPSSLNVQATRIAPITVYALRSEGFAGDIEVKLKGAPAGYVL
ncbi:MAG: peptidase, partial [Bacteroidota bacterium]